MSLRPGYTSKFHHLKELDLITAEISTTQTLEANFKGAQCKGLVWFITGADGVS